jgi:hypothetical protein
MEELIRRVLQEVYQTLADGSEGTVTSGGGTDDKKDSEPSKKEPEKKDEPEAFIEFEGAKIPKGVWDKLQKEKQAELDRIATKASQTARENAKKELEAEIEKKKLEADGKWKELLELERQQRETLKKEFEAEKLKILVREKLAEKGLDPNTWANLVSGTDEPEILKSIETLASNIEKVKTDHLEELKKKGPDGISKPGKVAPGEAMSRGKRLAEQRKQAEEIVKAQENYFGHE